MNREKRLEITRVLERRGFRPAPGNVDGSDGAVDCDTPDGVYFNFSNGDDNGVSADAIQLIVVGLMNHRPCDLARMVGGAYRVVANEFLEIAPDAAPEAADKILGRGFVSITLDVAP